MRFPVASSSWGNSDAKLNRRGSLHTLPSGTRPAKFLGEPLAGSLRFCLAATGRIHAHPRPGEKKTDKLFDGTAPDAVDQLAASLLAQLTPPWARWFGLAAGTEIFEEEEAAITDLLDQTAKTLQSHLDRSNFAVEMHQGFLDLVTGGTACLLFEEAEPGAASAFRFTAIPLSQAVLNEGPAGRLDTTFRRNALDADAIQTRFPKAPLPEWVKPEGEACNPKKFTVIEAVIPDGVRYAYYALLESEKGEAAEP